MLLVVSLTPFQPVPKVLVQRAVPPSPRFGFWGVGRQKAPWCRDPMGRSKCHEAKLINRAGSGKKVASVWCWCGSRVDVLNLLTCMVCQVVQLLNIKFFFLHVLSSLVIVDSDRRHVRLRKPRSQPCNAATGSLQSDFTM